MFSFSSLRFNSLFNAVIDRMDFIVGVIAPGRLLRWETPISRVPSGRHGLELMRCDHIVNFHDSQCLRECRGGLSRRRQILRDESWSLCGEKDGINFESFVVHIQVYFLYEGKKVSTATLAKSESPLDNANLHAKDASLFTKIQSCYAGATSPSLLSPNRFARTRHRRLLVMEPDSPTRNNTFLKRLLLLIFWPATPRGHYTYIAQSHRRRLRQIRRPTHTWRSGCGWRRRPASDETSSDSNYAGRQRIAQTARVAWSTVAARIGVGDGGSSVVMDMEGGFRIVGVGRAGAGER